MQQVIVEISRAIPVISVKGIKGKSCTAETKDLEKALGKVTKSTPTREMNENPTQINKAVH